MIRDKIGQQANPRAYVTTDTYWVWGNSFSAKLVQI